MSPTGSAMGGGLRARLTVTNHRGRPVPAVLGLWLSAGAGLALIVAGLTGALPPGSGWVALSCLATFIAGFVDDLSGGTGPRGMRGHLRALGSGRVTTGAVKVIVIVAAATAAVAAVGDGRGTPAQLAGVVLVAGTANAWNGLDVRPGRALKWWYVASLPAVVALADWRLLPEAAGMLTVGIPALVWDLRERAMLGDSGANLLGFVAGVGLFLVLAGPWVIVAAFVAVALNVLAETVSFSQIIDGSRLLTWMDRAGTLPPDDLPRG